MAAHYEHARFGGMTSKTGDYHEANPFRFSSEYLVIARVVADQLVSVAGGSGTKRMESLAMLKKVQAEAASSNDIGTDKS